MCGHHRGHGFGQHRFARRGFPDREQLVDRLRSYQEHLDREQQKIKELLERLADPQEQTQQV